MAGVGENAAGRAMLIARAKSDSVFNMVWFLGMAASGAAPDATSRFVFDGWCIAASSAVGHLVLQAKAGARSFFGDVTFEPPFRATARRKLAGIVRHKRMVNNGICILLVIWR